MSTQAFQHTPHSLASSAPTFISQCMVYGALTGLIVAWMQRRMYAARSAGGKRQIAL